MSDFKLDAFSYEDLIKYRRHDALAGEATFRSMTDKFVATNPRADLREMLAALVGKTDIGFAEYHPDSIDAVFWDGGAFLLASLSRRGASITVLAPDLEAQKRAEEATDRLTPFAAREPEAVGVWATFSTLTKTGVRSHTRFVACPRLKDIRENYPAQTFQEIEELASDPSPWGLGKLVIWSGTPGTGKTYALRSLMHAWQELFDIIVVNDPERFAEEPSYYFHVVGYAASSYEEADDEERPKAPARRSPRPKFIIMEDAADLILLESRSRHYDKLGKLLNLTDGLYGQGRKDLFLVTFNEQISDIDPGFLRPGRCRANVVFPSMSPSEAKAWLLRHGIDEVVREEMTLAELYRKLHKTRR